MPIGYCSPVFMPSADWWIQAAGFSTLRIDSEVPFDYRSVQRRCILTTAQGPKSYSLSLLGGRNKGRSVAGIALDWTQPSMRDLPMALTTNYSRTPYFDELFPEFMEIWHAQPKPLYLLNQTLMKWAQKRLGLNIEILTVPDFDARFPLIESAGLPIGVRYRQMFDDLIGFVPEASTFDLLFNLGPEFGFWAQDFQQDLQ
ncbi:MAG: WbqC family protein [Bacteroidetes bacterium]|nr:WbqC family protein [Bacteroidota bacterium]